MSLIKFDVFLAREVEQCLFLKFSSNTLLLKLLRANTLLASSVPVLNKLNSLTKCLSVYWLLMFAVAI